MASTRISALLKEALLEHDQATLLENVACYTEDLDPHMLRCAIFYLNSILGCRLQTVLILLADPSMNTVAARLDYISEYKSMIDGYIEKSYQRRRKAKSHETVIEETGTAEDRLNLYGTFAMLTNRSITSIRARLLYHIKNWSQTLMQMMKGAVAEEQKLQATFVDECQAMIGHTIIRLFPKYVDESGRFTNICNSSEFQSMELNFNYSELRRQVISRYMSVMEPGDKVTLRARVSQRLEKYLVIGSWKELSAVVRRCHNEKAPFPSLEVIIDTTKRVCGRPDNDQGGSHSDQSASLDGDKNAPDQNNDDNHEPASSPSGSQESAESVEYSDDSLSSDAPPTSSDEVSADPRSC